MWIVNVYNIQARITLTREKETTSDSDARKWICCSAAAMAYNKKKEIRKDKPVYHRAYIHGKKDEANT